MMDYFYMGMHFLTALLEVGLLYIWLGAFSGKRKLNHGIIATVILCSVVIRAYTNCMENTAFAMIVEIFCCFLISALLFCRSYRSIFFYAITNYAFVISVECLFSRLLNIPEMYCVLLFVIYFVLKMYSLKTVSSSQMTVPARTRYTKTQYTWKKYLLFYSIPIAVCIGTAWIYISGYSHEMNSGMYFAPVIAEVVFIMANSAAVYLHETLDAMIMKTQALEMVNIRLELEAKHYQNMDSLHEQYDSYIHDMKHAMRTIAALAEDGDCERIGSLIDKMRMNIGKIEQKMICSDKLLNALLLERKSYADNNGIVMDMEIREPLYFQEIDEVELIVLMGNLLDNAIEAEKRAKNQEGIHLCIRMAREGRHMIIQLENSCEDKYSDSKVKIKRDGQLGNKHGIGLESVRNIVRKYGGIIENEKSEGRYLVKVILPVQSEWEGQKSYSNPAPSYLQLLSK